ncbi:DUF4406 domain-containing protein [Comamonas sp. SY3]|uniref:DUF4406 domain-containing protein n=1 Tax=Comamonas sp. SY3 TaxID=3243601 RepID=UPI0035940DB0
MTKIYIAGPMTGLPEFNYPAFNAAAAELRARGHEVFNPAENPVPACGSWAGYMRQALAQLLQCEAIYLLPEWIRSKGARLESRVATDLGLVRMYSPAEAERMARLNAAIAEAQAQGSRVAVVEGSPVFFSCEGDHEARCESSNTQQCDECEGFGTVNDSKDDCPSCGGDGWIYTSDAGDAP